MNAIRTAFDQILSDESKTGNGLEQLRIFYNQAYDLDTLAEQGVDGIKPYVKAVMDTESLDELKALLVSEDFPFSPWITFSIAPADKRETNLVEIYPNLLLSDITMTGGDPYQDSDDPVKAQGAQQMLLTDEFYATYEAALILGTQGEEVQEIAQKIFDFEKSYAKELETTYGAASQAYGEASNSMSRAPWKNLRAHSQTSPSRSF